MVAYLYMVVSRRNVCEDGEDGEVVVKRDSGRRHARTRRRNGWMRSRVGCVTPVGSVDWMSWRWVRLLLLHDEVIVLPFAGG